MSHLHPLTVALPIQHSVSLAPQRQVAQKTCLTMEFHSPLYHLFARRRLSRQPDVEHVRICNIPVVIFFL